MQKNFFIVLFIAYIYCTVHFLQRFICSRSAAALFCYAFTYFFRKAPLKYSYSLARVINSLHRFFTRHMQKHTGVGAWSRNGSDFKLQMSLGSKSHCFNLTFGLTHTQVHSVCPIFSNFRILILPGKAMFAALKSHLYCAVLEWRMK